MDRIGGSRSTGSGGSGRSGSSQQRPSWLGTAAYLVAGLLLVWFFQVVILAPLRSAQIQVPYSQFRQDLASGQIVSASIGQTEIDGTIKNPTPIATPATVPFSTAYQQGADPQLVPALQQAGIQYSFQAPPSPLGDILLSWVLPIALFGGLWYFGSRRMSGLAGGQGGPFGIGRSTAKQIKPEQVGVTYKDVGGADEAIAELREIIEFLKAPGRFIALGGRIPKGVMLVGPPGTGKTLLAKATAGEAGVPFFETSGSEFVELFVGVGAARVRDLFVQARQAAPAIVFIDEIDAIGQSRANSVRFGTNDEREQTLNQLLAELDGFNTSESTPVIIMAATNRPEVLDPALLRAGRFDRQVQVGNPDVAGRRQILRIHGRNVRQAPDFDVDRAARITAGFSGADLANVMNEAALQAARRGESAVTNADFESAIERVVAGLEQKTRMLDAQTKSTVAHHESGHALVAVLVGGDPVGKISIVPHSRGALGYTLQLPDEDRYLLTVGQLEDRLATMLGGRAAEVVVFGTISTGASDDIQRATDLARRMVTEFGMSPSLGSVRYAGQQLQYLDGAVRDSGQVSPETELAIDREVQRLVTEQLERAQGLLLAHRAALESLTKQLLEHETVDGVAVTAALTEEVPTSTVDDGHSSSDLPAAA